MVFKIAIFVTLIIVSVMSSKGLKVLITGSSRGIGLGLVKRYLSEESNTVIATCRSGLTEDGSSELMKLKREYKERLHVFKLDVTRETSFRDLLESLDSVNVKNLDVVVANAG